MKSAQKRPNKLQRLMSSTKRAKQKRMAKALNEYLKVRNPGTKLAGAKVIKNAGGSITIIPIKLRKNPKSLAELEAEGRRRLGFAPKKKSKGRYSAYTSEAALQKALAKMVLEL